MSNGVEQLSRALDLMTRALALIDEASEALDVGAHLELAIERLRQHLEGQAPD